MSLAKIEELCGKVMSTTSSGRSDAGKNCRGTKGDARMAAAKQASGHPDGDPAHPHRFYQDRPEPSQEPKSAPPGRGFCRRL